MIDIDKLISEEINDKGAQALKGAPIAESDLPDYAGTVLSAAGPSLVAAAFRHLTTLRAFRDVQGDLFEQANLLDPPGLRSWWVSWYGIPGVAGEFEYHGPWWITGSRGDWPTIVAAVQAPTEGAARGVILSSYDSEPADLEWRFVEERPADWDPFDGTSDRFPRADWMRWPYPAEA
jgi:hypothetical protein